MNTIENQNTIFPLGERTPAEYFTGKAYLKLLVEQDETGSYRVANVVFEPGSRTNWHTHATGQILLITQGKGYYQEKGKAARLLTKGDTVIIPSQVEHWHGAAHDSSFTHIAITNNATQGSVQWLTAVTEDEYSSCQEN
jgi:4-carboxymuconolactone decarboxylase